MIKNIQNYFIRKQAGDNPPMLSLLPSVNWTMGLIIELLGYVFAVIASVILLKTGMYKGLTVPFGVYGGVGVWLIAMLYIYYKLFSRDQPAEPIPYWLLLGTIPTIALVGASVQGLDGGGIVGAILYNLVISVAGSATAFVIILFVIINIGLLGFVIQWRNEEIIDEVIISNPQPEPQPEPVGEAGLIMRTLISSNIEVYDVDTLDSYQHTVYRISHSDSPKKIDSLMDKLALTLGVDPSATTFVPVHSRGVSAIIVPKADSWESVIPLEVARRVKPSDATIHIGNTVEREEFNFQLRKNPYGLFSGQTGSGKTEALKVAIYGILQVDVPVKVTLIDFKNKGFRPFEKAVDKYTTSINEALVILRSLKKIGEARYEKYNGDTYWQYQERNKSEPLFAVFIDEVADLLEFSDEAVDLIEFICRKYREAGIVLYLGVQKPNAKLLPTRIRDNLVFKWGGRVENGKASEVAISSTGCERLLGEGNALVRKGGLITTTMIRTAFVKDSELTAALLAKGLETYE